jgi:hypothetical protein
MSEESSIKSLTEKRAKLVRQLVSQDEILKNIDAIDRVLKLLGHNSNKPINTLDAKHSPIPTEYSSALTWDQKFLYALASIESGLGSEIATKLCEIDSNLNKEQVHAKARFVLSKLKSEGIIQAEVAEGNKNRFWIAKK